MHFMGGSPLNLPFYLLRSLSKMEYKVQGKQSQVEPSLFHFSLTKLLVLLELNRRNQSWKSFIDSSKLEVDLPANSLSNKDTPSYVERDIQSPIGSLVKIPSVIIDPPKKMKGRKLHFSPEVVKVSKRPLTRSSANKLPIEQTPKQPSKPLEAIPGSIVPSDKGKEILELQEQLKKTRLVLVQLQHDNMELKKVALERKNKANEEEPMTKVAQYISKSKGKEKIVREYIQEVEAPSARVTRSSTRKL